MPTNEFEKTEAAHGALVEVSQEHFYYMLEVLPPIYARGCFAMGEAKSHDMLTDEPTYYWAGKRGRKCYSMVGTKAMAEAQFDRR